MNRPPLFDWETAVSEGSDLTSAPAARGAGEGEGEAFTSKDGAAVAGEDTTVGSYSRRVVATGTTSIATSVTIAKV